MIDSHVHSLCSHDSKESVTNICRAAIEKGLVGVTITDHADMGPCDLPDTYDRFLRRKDEIAQAKDAFASSLRVFEGIEMAEYFYDIPLAERLLALSDYDVVIGSVHYVAHPAAADAYSRTNFSALSPEVLDDYIRLYFSEVHRVARETDIDILAHLTCPIRYINVKHGCGVDFMRYEKEIRAIFETVIQRGISLEINTSGVDSPLADVIPGASFLSLYRSMGGERISLGSDAHSADRVALGFSELLPQLRALGFTHLTHYERRRPVFTQL